MRPPSQTPAVPPPARSEQRPLLLLTSSYPAPGDFSGIFIREFRQALPPRHPSLVLVPTRCGRSRGEPGETGVRSFRYLLPAAAERLFHGPGALETIADEPVQSLAVPPAVAGMAWRATRLARKAKMVVSHWLVPAGACGMLAARAAGVPHLAIAHGGDVALLERSPAGRLLAGTIVRTADRVVAVGRGVRDRLARATGIDPATIPVVPMGVPAPLYAIPPVERLPARFEVLYLGRLTRSKGVEVLLAACDRHPRVRSVILAGSGPAGRSGHGVELAGVVAGSGREGLLARTPVLVLPSLLDEGMPRSLLEGMAAGRIVAVSDTPTARELVVDGCNGFLFPRGDAAGLAAVFERIARLDRARVVAITAGARERVQAYRWQAVAASYSEIIDACLDRVKAARPAVG